MDGHSSHVNLGFLDYADQNRILVVILPSHSTHRLQPLDVGLFSSLATYYTNELDKLIADSQDFTRMTKQYFWRLFKPSWERAFCKMNILSAFKATGIHPLDASKVLDQIKRKTPSPLLEPTKATPTSLRAIRRAIRQINKEQQLVSTETQKLFHTSKKLATENSIDRKSVV